MQRKRNHQGSALRHSRSCPATSGGRCAASRPTRRASTRRARQEDPQDVPDARGGEGLAGRRHRRPPQGHDSRAAPSRCARLRRVAAARRTARSARAPATRTSRPRSAATGGARDRVLPDLGGASWRNRRVDVRTSPTGCSTGPRPSTIRNTLMPLRAIYRRALARGEVAVNPTTGLELPAVAGRRDRIASPEEAGALLAALPEGDRALWATALYAGLRRGELMALRWEDVDLAAGVIRVERAGTRRRARSSRRRARAGGAGCRSRRCSATT